MRFYAFLASVLDMFVAMLHNEPMNTTMTSLLASAANLRAIRIDCYAKKATSNAVQKLIADGLLVAVDGGKASITEAGRAALAAAPVAAPVVVVARTDLRATEANKVATVTAPKGKLFTSTVTLANGSTRTVIRAKRYAFAVLNTDGTVARWTNI